MDIRTFDLLTEFQRIENNLYFKLEKEVGMEKAEEYVDEFTDLREKTLLIGKYLDSDAYVGKDTYLIRNYRDLDRYLKMHVIYEYEGSWCLCTTTSELICFVPKNYLAEYE